MISFVRQKSGIFEESALETSREIEGGEQSRQFYLSPFLSQLRRRVVTHFRVYIHTHTTHTHTHAHTKTYTHIHAHTHTHTHTDSLTHTHTGTYIHAHTQSHPHKNTYTHRHAHTHDHTHTHAHRLSLSHTHLHTYKHTHTSSHTYKHTHTSSHTYRLKDGKISLPLLLRCVVVNCLRNSMKIFCFKKKGFSKYNSSHNYSYRLILFTHLQPTTQ